MENKENVYEEKIPQTEQAISGEMEQGSTVLGKFKDVSALERAYSALQAEFTRRSQRLKTLESALKMGKTDNFKSESGQESGVEKLRAVAAKKREEGKEFDCFVTELEQNARKDDCGQVEEKPVLQSAEESDLALENATLSGVEGDNVQANQSNKSNLLRESEDENFNRLPGLKENLADVAAQTVYSSDALYEAVKKDEGARMRIIGDYLASIRRSGAPLMKGGGNLSVTPTIRAKSISDAGTMALRLFQKDGVNA